MNPRPIFAALAAIALVLPAARAQIVVSANDGKALFARGDVPALVDDTATIIDLNVSPPKVLGEVKAPAAMTGPPQSVAIAPDESIALVTGAWKTDPANPKRTVPDNRVTVIDLKARPPVVLATLETGGAPTGVSFNPAGTMALVANRTEGTVSVLNVSGKSVTVGDKISLCDNNCAPSHVIFTNGGRRALVSRNNDDKISILSVSGSEVEYTKIDMIAAAGPYSMDVTPSGDVAVVANVASGLVGGIDLISVIDLGVEPPHVVDHVTIGVSPECVSLSADGRWLAVALMNGSNFKKTSPYFHDYGLLKILSLNGTKLTPVTETKVGHLCQGVVWKSDNSTLLVQCPAEQEIQVIGFNGQTLTRTGSIKINGSPVGIRVAQRAGKK
jgi:DNA-binding beta-propeller fold protein YncE